MEITDARLKTFETELLPHMGSLYYFALKKTLDPDDAADLIQDTYLNAFRYIDKYKSGTNAKGWLYRIMMNSFINRYRNRRKQPEKIRYEDIEEFYLVVREPAADNSALQYNKMIDDQLGDEIANALQALADNYRTVVILSDIEGYTYEEISDLIEIPIGTVRSRLHRGRMILRSVLKDYAVKHGYRVRDGESIQESTSQELANEVVVQSSPA